jgi:hypothetical protein
MILQRNCSLKLIYYFIFLVLQQPSFVNSLHTVSRKNNLSPKIHQGTTRLFEAGISNKWESLETTNELLNLMRNNTRNKTTIPEYFAKLMFKPRDPIVSENQPNSMKVMKFIMILCTILLVGAGTGGVALLLEFTISG